MKTNIVKLFFGAAVALSTVSCEDFLTVSPVDKVGAETFFAGEKDLLLFANGMLQNYLPSESTIGLGDAYCDLVATKTSNDYYRPNIWDYTKQSGWSISNWRTIRRANYFLENMTRCQNVVDPEVYNHYVGVARFWRAYFYFDKVKTFGNVPWVDHVLDIDDAILFAARDDREFVMSKVLEDLDYACENCLGTDVYKGVINKWVVLAFKSRVCLYEGTFRKYHSVNPSTNAAWNNQYETANDFLTAAASAAKEVMTDGGFELYKKGTPEKDFRTIFTSQNPDATKEVIWIREMAGDPINVFNELTWKFNSATYGQQYSPTKDLVHMFLTLDGKPVETDQVSLTKEFDNRDWRLSQTVHGPGHTYQNSAGTTMLKNIDFSTTKTGYAFIKWSVEIQENYSKGKADNSLPILRLGEVLLNYAEAKAELGEMDKSIWNETVGALRERAGVTNIYPEDANYVEDEWLKDYYADSPIKLSNTLLEIRRERVTELIMENGLRVSDLYRWKLGNLIRDRSTGNQGWKGIYLSTDEYNNGFEFNGYKYLFKDQAQGTYSYPIGQSSDDMNYTLSDGDHGYLIYNYELQWDEKRYVRPIPSTALTKNPNLGQNYGWEQ